MTASQIVLTKTKSGLTKTVTLMTRDTEENWTKSLILITAPIADLAQDMATGASDTLMVDILMKAEHRFTVDGYLINATISGDSSTTAKGRKNDIQSMFFAGGSMTLTYDGDEYKVNSDKISVKFVGHDVPTGQQDVAIYDVKLTLVKGVDYGSGD